MLTFFLALWALAFFLTASAFLAYWLGWQARAAQALPRMELSNVLVDHVEVLQSQIPGLKMFRTKVKYIVTVLEDELHDSPGTRDFFIYNHGGNIVWKASTNSPVVVEALDETQVMLPPYRQVECIHLTYLEDIDTLSLHLTCKLPFNLGKEIKYTVHLPMQRAPVLALPPPLPAKDTKVLRFDPLFRHKSKKSRG